MGNGAVKKIYTFDEVRAELLRQENQMLKQIILELDDQIDRLGVKLAEVTRRLNIC